MIAGRRMLSITVAAVLVMSVSHARDAQGTGTGAWNRRIQTRAL